MALTAAQQFVGCYIANGVLDMAPGGYMTALADVINANGTNYRAITKAVVATSLFTDKYPTYLTNDQFAANYATNLVGTTVSATAMTALKAQIVSQLNAGQSRGDVVYNVLETLYSKPATDADFGAAATSLQNQAEVARYYTVDKLGASTDLATLRAVTSSVTDAASVVTAKAGIDAAFAGSVSSPALTTGMDNVGGTSGDDSFTARIFDNSNTLQSGDKISGGSGTDTLFADIGDSQHFAITPETTGVENIVIRAQAVSADKTDNNTSITSEVQIDAERVTRVQRLEDNNSRADLLIEDVRIDEFKLDNYSANNGRLTKDVTIAMVSTDPGHVDYGVYFDQHSLRAGSQTSSVLRLQLMDTKAAVETATANTPLLNSPYDSFVFKLNGVLTTIKSTAIDAAQTYDQLFTAIQAEVAKNPALANVTVTKGNTFPATDTATGKTAQGTEIVLTSTNGGVFNSTDPGTGWVPATPIPSDSGLHTKVLTTANTVSDKITSTIVLDDVGRGSNGGDLVVGGLSVGDTSTSKGVEQFDITVGGAVSGNQTSKLQHIASTDNQLQIVNIVNAAGTTDNLNVLGKVTTGNNPTGSGAAGGVTGGVPSAIDTPLPGIVSANGGDQHGAFGFSDVRVVNGATFAGKLNFNAELTTRSIAKYLNLVDTAANPADDNQNFQYLGGLNDDAITVSIDSGLAASRSNVLAGREDFTVSVDGGAGNDTLTVRVNNSTGVTGNTEAWYRNQDLNKNVTINGGAGDDTINKPGAGDVTINGGAGNDTIYTDNTGAQVHAVAGSVTSPVFGQWVFNTADQTLATVAVPTPAARNINNIASDVNNSANIFAAKLTVNFGGITKQVDLNSSAYKTTDLQINQAIKTAINSDVVLNKLLSAEDGPANSLVVLSKIDGVMADGDLTVSIAAPAAGTLSLADITAASAAYGVAATEVAVIAAINSAIGAGSKFVTDYTARLANDGAGVVLTGVDSTSTSDNVVSGGTGNDVIVLGTTGYNTAAADFRAASNEIVKFEAGFGSDTVVNFSVSGNGQDFIDFSAIGGTSTAALNAMNTTAGSINIAVAAVANNSEAAVAALFGDVATSTVDRAYTYVRYDAATNVGTVFKVVDVAGLGGVTATQQGTIELDDGAMWGSLTAGNFVTAESALNGYGPQLGAVAGPTPPGGGANVTLSTAGQTTAATALADVFTLVNGPAPITVNITGGFDGTVDKILVPAGTAMPAVSAGGVNGVTDGAVNLIWTDSTGDAVTIQLTGLAAASETALQAGLMPGAFGTA